MEKLYYSISEVAEILGENISLVRFWSNNFKRFLKLSRSSKGNRQYTSEDIATLKEIHFLVDRGLNFLGFGGCHIVLNDLYANYKDR